MQLAVGERALLARLLDDVEGLLAEDAAEREGVGSAGPGEGMDDPGEGMDGVLASLEAQLTPPPPSDPAVARLLPAGHRDDPDLAAGYRRLVEPGLRARKRAGLELASAALVRGEPVVLDTAEALALLKGLTDVRLVLAERLGLRADSDAEALHATLARADNFDDPRTAAAALYDALTWWQESLVGALH